MTQTAQAFADALQASCAAFRTHRQALPTPAPEHSPSDLAYTARWQEHLAQGARVGVITVTSFGESDLDQAAPETVWDRALIDRIAPQAEWHAPHEGPLLGWSCHRLILESPQSAHELACYTDKLLQPAWRTRAGLYLVHRGPLPATLVDHDPAVTAKREQAERTYRLAQEDVRQAKAAIKALAWLETIPATAVAMGTALSAVTQALAEAQATVRDLKPALAKQRAQSMNQPPPFTTLWRAPSERDSA